MAVKGEMRAYAREFNRAQRLAIKRLAVVAEPVANMPGVGQATIDGLVAYGLVAVAGEHRHGDPTYRLTDAGNELYEALYEMGRLP